MFLVMLIFLPNQCASCYVNFPSQSVCKFIIFTKYLSLSVLPVSIIYFQLWCVKNLSTCKGIHQLQNWLMGQEEEDVLKIQMKQTLLV